MVIVTLRVPVQFILTITCPMVVTDNWEHIWHKKLFVLIAFFSIPFLVLVFLDDAFYYDDEVGLPAAGIAALIGLVLALAVGFTTSPSKAPRFSWAWASLGFVIALAGIYAIADEVGASRARGCTRPLALVQGPLAA